VDEPSLGNGDRSAEHQVLTEFDVTVTRKLLPGMTGPDARAEIRDLTAWKPVPMTDALFGAPSVIEDRFGLSFWDALIVSAARHAGCDQLLTEDLQNDQDFGGVRVLDPFHYEPGV
jgi:predicted nucleic acid-binding protein